MKAQCGAYGAPSAIHWRRSAACAGVTRLCDSGGGITSVGSLDVIRRITSLSAGWPGRIAAKPSRSCVALSRSSSLSFPSRLAGSWP